MARRTKRKGSGVGSSRKRNAVRREGYSRSKYVKVKGRGLTKRNRRRIGKQIRKNRKR